jgi:ATP10 protein
MCYQDLRNEQKMMGLTNIGLGWVHLVDKEGKIRWQAHGIPVEHELQSMVELARKISSANKVEN